MGTKFLISILYIFISLYSLAQPKIYYSTIEDTFYHVIRRVNIDGSGNEKVLESNRSRLVDLEVDLVNDKLYWVHWNYIMDSDLDGSNQRTLVDRFGNYYFIDGISLDRYSEKIYWAARGSLEDQESGLFRMNLDGTNIQQVVHRTEERFNFSSIALDLCEGKIYWIRNRAIERANLDGSSIETLVESAIIFGDLELDIRRGKIYWTDYIRNTISRANLDGSAVEIIVDYYNSRINGIALEPESYNLFWCTTFGSIYKATMDGENVEEIIKNAGSMENVEVAYTDPYNRPMSDERFVKVYPNPVREILQVENSGGYNELHIYNSSGALCLKEDFVPKLLELDISQLASGVYFLSCRTVEGEVTTTRFVKVD